MKAHRIFGIILRYLYLFRHSFDRLSDAFYWPTMDLLLWGITSMYFRTYSSGGPSVTVMIISGILFWIIVWRGQYEISVNLLEDLWNKNLINIFVAPVSFYEWVSSFLILGIIKATLSFTYGAVVAYILYRVHIFSYGFSLLPIMLLLIMTGWWSGFMGAGIILRYGTKIQTVAWSLVTILSPFSAIYYPLAILPLWAQKIALFIPTSYAFEAARKVINQGYFDMQMFFIAFFLNIFYIVLSIIFLRRSFDKALDRGLVKVV
ncbi:MAG: ABC transporter permease [Patescibacteria group bacterium]